jgi:predicted NUDIX family NTP pyrophosphohydrolase
MAKMSAGILMYREAGKNMEVLLAHPGGPFWAKKDLAAWSVPKGEFDESEEPLAAALREVEEETGFTPQGNFVELEPVKTKAGKKIFAWAVESNADPVSFKSNFFEMEWPPRSGKKQKFPEVDKVEWFDMHEAEKRISPSQLPLLSQLKILLNPR